MPDSARDPTPLRTQLQWDENTLLRLQGGTYGRMIRLQSGNILCSYESDGKAWVSRSNDNGKTWKIPVLVQALNYASAANPELLELKSGRVLLFYNQRPRDEKHRFAIAYCISDNRGFSWRPATTIYEASQKAQDGCWEPAALQLPSGEIQLFFANEFPYPDSIEQEITLMRSLDEGATWGKPETVSFRAGHRDGMPVPFLLQGSHDIVVAIEDNGLTPGNMLHPALISTSQAANWHQPVVSGTSPLRWNALSQPLTAETYAGAPYLRQFPTGEMLLSCQSDEGFGADGKRQKPRMVVYIGDAHAHEFANPTVPFAIAGNVSGSWNSLFIKDANTVTALSDTTINGVRGLWAIDGHLIAPPNMATQHTLQ